MLRPARDDRIAENLIDDLQHAPGCLVVAPLLQRLDHIHDVPCFQLGDVRFADDRENIRLQPVHDGSLMFFGELGHAGFMPFSGDVLEALAFGCDSGLLFFPLLFGRINTFDQQTPGILAPLSGIPERDGGVFPETEQLALTVKTVSHAPELAAAGGDIKEQAAAIEILAGL